MSDRWLSPDLVFDGQDLLNNTALRVVDGVVQSLVSTQDAPPSAEEIFGILSPGLVDLQVNGGGGVLFNATPTADGIRKIASAHRQFGTTGILPTVITDTKEVLTQAVDAVLEAQGSEGILGIHIEGPHISMAHRGTHAEQHVRPMDNATIGHVARLREASVAVLITLAPEAATSDQIARLSALGAVVSIGHSDATAEETKAAIKAGVSCATHLFTAMAPMQSRAPGVTGAVINSESAAGIIVDGIHVADDMVGLALRARPKKDLTFLVSDAMPTVGGPDHFNLYGMDVTLVDGRLVNAEGNLAGAHVTMAEGVARLANEVGLDRAESLRAAITVPARLIEQGARAEIVGTQSRNLICLDRDLRFTGFLDE